MRSSILAAIILAAVTLTPSAAAQRQRNHGSSAWAITPELQRAVQRGHRWLAERQNPRGYWGQDIGFKARTDYRVTARNAPHVGVTSLALMSFLAGGHLPGRGEYGQTLERGLDYVISCVRENGLVTDFGSRMYSHAFATLFLAEVYGMTPQARVRRALQQAVNLIVDSQNAEGGWRYRPFARESDMSITVCQVLALRSARNVGISVPASTIKAAETYVRRSAADRGSRGRSRHHRLRGVFDEGGAFLYQLRQRTRSSFPLTAAGVTTLFAAGIYEDELVRRALDYLISNLQGFTDYYAGHYFFYYGHYYAVQAFYIAGGSAWTTYFRTIRRKLLDLQEPAGSWPCDPGPGAAFGTAVATLILQIPFQYLPIFQR